MALQDEIVAQSDQIKTDSYPMSIGELMNLYRDKELDVHPEFQRVFRWTPSQKTKLIESILLGIPIPPIFVAQRKDGVWDVIDGVQRLSTIFQFIGILRDENGKLFAPLVLEKTKFLPSLENKLWEHPKKEGDSEQAVDAPEDLARIQETVFTPDQRLYIKRAKIDVNIVLKESNEKTKYELFMRLNTLGSALSAQEVRNCLMIMAYPDLYTWIKELASFDPFLKTTSLSDMASVEQYPMELVTRFLTFRTIAAPEILDVGDIGEYLNNELESINAMMVANKTVEETAFRQTFQRLFTEFEGDAFRKFEKDRGKYLGSFSISSFEAIALGVGYNTNPDGTLRSISDLRGKAQSIWTEPDFLKYSGSGVRASSRLPKIVPLGRRLFAT